MKTAMQMLIEWIEFTQKKEGLYVPKYVNEKAIELLELEKKQSINDFNAGYRDAEEESGGVSGGKDISAFYHPDGGADSPNEGLTKREYFAAIAMQAYIIGNRVRKISLLDRIKIFFGHDFKRVDNLYSKTQISEASIRQADDIIKSLNKQP